MSARRRAAALLGTCVLATGCWGSGWLGFGGGRGPEVVEDARAAGFAARIRSFYDLLEGVPIAAETTHSDPRLPGFFTGRVALQDYMASLTAQVRASQLRGGLLDRFEVLEFRMLEDDRAVVELRLVGEHARGLRFWGLELPRTDHWRQVRGIWTVSPDRL